MEGITERSAAISSAIAGRRLRRVLRTRTLRPRRLPSTASLPPAATGPRPVRGESGLARPQPAEDGRQEPSWPVPIDFAQLRPDLRGPL